MSKTLTKVAAAATLALGLSAATGLPAQAQGGDDASSHGNCSATSSYKLQANGHKGTIRVKVKVDTKASGEVWTFTIADNGTPVVVGDETSSKNGKFTVVESIPNLEGTDTIDFTAIDTVTGETCTAQVVFAG